MRISGWSSDVCSSDLTNHYDCVRPRCRHRLVQTGRHPAPQDTKMIGEIRTREPAAGGFHIERQHPAVPSLIFLHEILENIGPACLHVGSFKRVVDDVEQEAVTENFEILDRKSVV